MPKITIEYDTRDINQRRAMEIAKDFMMQNENKIPHHKNTRLRIEKDCIQATQRGLILVAIIK